MKDFATLFTQLDQTTKTNTKVAALVDYFKIATDRDRLWVIAILSGRRPRRTIQTSLLREWAADSANLPRWLFEDSYRVVGDLAETIALILPPPTTHHQQSLAEWIEMIQQLKTADENEKKRQILAAWTGLNRTERFIFNKLITGNFRVGVSQKLVIRALAQFEEQTENVVAHRLMGNWTPDTTTYQTLLRADNPLDDISRPYPFYLAHALEDAPESLGELDDWQVERKWDGIRGQIIVRKGHLFVWSRGEELVTDKFPEYHPLSELLPDGTVIDGEILPFKDGQILSFNTLQTRIGRKNVTPKVRAAAPVVLRAYDLLEHKGEDIRNATLHKRRQLLEQLLRDYPVGHIVQLSECITAADWKTIADIRANSRAFFSEGLMLKRRISSYKSGRKRGDWWKWKIDPLTIDAVMIYAQQGSGRRANLYTDYTFAVWEADKLVPFTKAYSGLTDAEFRKITAWVRKNTLERFGPVRRVPPLHVFEIAFEGIQKSNRHKSGVALRFPRMLRWRKDKKVDEANTLSDLKQMLEMYGQ
ncbi:MAG: ATP-dependent DNA ligase [Bacteroidota bacterium]